MLCESLPRNVRILLVGDPGVGKTSLILSLVSEEFTEYAPAKAEEITIPADVTPEQVPTNIVDYSASEQTLENLADEMTKAHVICVVYAVDQQETLDNIRTRWLPLIREHNDDDKLKPVVLVGNKIDLIDYSTIDAIWDIAEDYPEIDRCIECSAKTLTNVSEMFYNAQIAVLHPIAPIYNIDEQELTDKCKKALTRIFKLCDIDGDGLLNDFELNHFQRKCFDAPLQLQVLDEVKAVLAKNIAGGIEDDCVTLKGFLFLHCLFIQRGRNETTWTVLRKFGYDETLQLNSAYLNPILKIPPGCTTELSYKGQQFLTQVFERYDRDRDGALNSTELKTVFSCCPKLPWHNIRQTVPTNEKGHLTLHGWMCRWTLMTLMDLDSTLANLAYLGFNVHENDSQKTAIHVTREKKIDQVKKQSSRNVYQCHVIGPRSSGKSSICRSFIGITNKKIRPVTDRGDSEPSANCCINTVQVYGQEKYLILKEIPISRVSDPLKPAEVNCDVACLVYDATLSRSFEYIARIYIKYFAESKIPVLIVGTQSDCNVVRQNYLLQPEVFCNKYQILPPQLFRLKDQKRDLFVKYFAESKIPVLIVGTQSDCNVVRQNYLLQPEVFCNKYQILPPQLFRLKDQKRDLFVKLATMAAFPHLKQFATFPGESGAWWKAGIGRGCGNIVWLDPNESVQPQ